MADRMFAWVWLPGADTPVRAGRIDEAGGETTFTYDRSYLDNGSAISLYGPELPLIPGRQRPRTGLAVAGCLRDAWPDGWSRVVIERKVRDRGAADDELHDFTYLRASGSDRIGAFDFTDEEGWTERGSRTATLDELQRAAEHIESGEELAPDLQAALEQATASGGMRPKALIETGGVAYVAKLSSRSDTRPVTKIEALAMDLAGRSGLDVARSELIHTAGRDILLVERFDRVRGRSGERTIIVSGATMLGLDPRTSARYATYHEIADILRAASSEPADARELFARITFNVLVGNTDDHARNHAASWDGRTLRLTPAYDICPQQRSGNETKQAMPIGRDGFRDANLAGCVERAGDYGLTRSEAVAIVEHQLTAIEDQWDDAADRARLTSDERNALRGRAILNESIFYGWERVNPGSGASRSQGRG